MLSIVIPAHNESSVIGRCLTSLLEGLQGSDFEIIVVCNGCKDDTADIARGYPGVKVIEVDVASKVVALNTGDREAQGFPRAYVDADIQLRGSDLLSATKHLDTPGIEIVAPRLHVNLSKSNALVKAFYGIWMQLPYFSDGQMVGSGVFILSESGRSRFGDFPQIIADDGYVRSLFKKQERLTAKDCSFTIFAPQTMADLIKIKSRVRFGNMELKLKYPDLAVGGENTPGALASLVMKKPWLVPAAMLYAYVQWQTKRNAAHRMAIADFSTWDRDNSSRI